MRLLVRRLLEERFALQTHVETRELPIYELVVAGPVDVLVIDSVERPTPD